MSVEALFLSERKKFHASLLESTLTIDKNGIHSNADKDSRVSREIARHIATQLRVEVRSERAPAQTSGANFEGACANFVRNTFGKLDHIRPGDWLVQQVGGRNRRLIACFEQYAHLVALDRAAKGNRELAAALGNDYTISPDIIISRALIDDQSINSSSLIVDSSTARQASLRSVNGGLPILHASISCKWTLRSDRAQNARSEALNLIRNRKGRLPHAVVVTAEPSPSRIASIALGTGDIDCTYHFALSELKLAVEELDFPDAKEMLDILIEGKRLRDISDLPLDLAV
ncbi:NgoMIV family type II restriction endonuclease [Stenotrophomonas maltophilia]|uniref:NgoMIV family type II restriction endonuclease n=1 Tax=Stenotrophomonas maltophilia TaxID=40324 RepID=UPI0013117C35|nr:NgoMIV family type II restriction endonuclease [Stenotrophomonas maltophilia]MBA0286662.1 restriction endonuclease [Stenotrophomonas maltophilia]MBA0325341.1 restriction endonuclease [Stenotrophomonas maltophilia]